MEFTGERVIPGQVEPDLWAEHFSRYRFAANAAQQLTHAPVILDIGCGSGYGTAALAEIPGSSATGIDVAPEAIEYARTHYTHPHLSYLPGSATDLPFENASFDLITAFEVIEHLQDPSKLLAEARRVLRTNGLLLVSTPNKTYYAETRAQDGPNPYHVHEFTFAEFAEALAVHFPSSNILLQNHTDAFTFYDPQTKPATDGFLETVVGVPTDAHFFLAICSAQPFAEPHNFVHVPSATNLLRTREHHIRILQREIQELKASIEATHTFLATAHAERDKMIQMYTEQASQLAARTEWALHLDREFNQKAADLKIVLNLLETAENNVIERTAWAQRAEAELHAAYEKMGQLKESRWIKLGRRLGLGPQVETPKTNRDV